MPRIVTGHTFMKIWHISDTHGLHDMLYNNGVLIRDGITYSNGSVVEDGKFGEIKHNGNIIQI